jgi:ABC-2 type transport system permease protein
VGSLLGQLLLLRKRKALWILLGFWLGMTVLFSYVLPYYAYLSGTGFERRVGQILLVQLLPQNLVATVMGSFPFFGGVIALILGVLSTGSEYSWGTLTYAFTQRASRLKVFFSKMLAVAIALVPFILLVYLLAFIASLAIALREGQAVDLPSLWSVVKALGASWFLMAVWASLGVLVSVLSRGTALAIGLGIIYGLVIENVITVFGLQVDFLNSLSKGLLRTNGYSLINALGATPIGEAGPGSFFGSYVSGTQSFLVLAGYTALFILVSAAIIRRRDIASSS